MNRAAVPDILFTPTWAPGRPRARAHNAPSIPNEIWDRHRDEIVKMYIHLDWKLDDVMRVMHTYNFFATKRQYTKKLKDWGCKKYKVHSKDDAPSEPSPAAEDPSSPPPDDALPIVPKELDNIALAGSLKEIQSLLDAAMARDPDITDGKTNAETKGTTAQEHTAVLGGDNNPWTEGAEGGLHGLIFDIDMTDGVLETISEERPASSLSIFERSSIEDASIRDYGSLSMVSLNFGHSRSPSWSTLPMAEVQSSPAPDTVPSAEWLDARPAVHDIDEQQAFTAVQDTETANVGPDWDMAGTTSTVDVPLNTASLAGVDLHTHPVLVPTPAVTSEVSPIALLLMIESSRVSRGLSEGDAVRIEQLAEVFEFARSYEDAYQLRRFVLLHAPLHGRKRGYALEHALVNVAKVLPDEAWRRLEAFRPKELVIPREVVGHSQPLEVVGWCINALAEDGFWKMLLPITPDLWLLAPSEAHLRDVESTLLFFYLWSQQPSEPVRQNLISDSVRSHSSCVLDFARARGISVAEVLSVVANYIITTLGLHDSCEKSTLARRAFTTARAVYESMEVNEGSRDKRANFMDVCVTVRRQKGILFSTEYATLVRTAVRDIVERSFHLELEISALRDPRLQNRLSQASMSPSYSPTMLSTPRSSWSGFQSFESIGRRGSKFWVNTNNHSNDVQSLLSSRRWSRPSSTKSALTLQSATTSARDVIMEDDIEI